ncbi:hypothetical protein BSKO_03307 [Bryopsis sp. KO-2023]|nr:hypothetical protein BSKO_03307 [Bryopsis sp. KO-2023]
MVKIVHRYLVVQVTCSSSQPRKIRKQTLEEALRGSIAENFGDHGLGVATSSRPIVYYNSATGVVVVKCLRSQYREVWLSLTLITHIEFEPVRIQMLRTTGVLKNCRSAVRHHQKMALEYLSPAEREEELERMKVDAFLRQN